MKLSIQDDFWWGVRLQLSSWAGYQSRLGPYGAIDKPKPSDGSLRLIFAPEGRDVEPLSEQELKLINWFEQNEPQVSTAVKQSLIHWCLLDSADRVGQFDYGDDFPKISNEDDLKRNTGLHGITIHQINKNGVPYIGYEFGCTWEEEHGLGVLMHGTRLVEIGFADTALHLWLADQDAKLT
jgi:hypothetical protein